MGSDYSKIRTGKAADMRAALKNLRVILLSLFQYLMRHRILLAMNLPW